MRINKAAMFGLDARIALAIFGVLSVISGAALYSAIQTSKATSLVVQMKEVAKAYEQYYLDLSEDLPRKGSSSLDLQRRQIRELVTSSKVGWKGPYLSYSSPAIESLNHPEFSSFYIVSTSIKDWGQGNATAPAWYDSDVLCSDSVQCYLWVLLTGINVELQTSVDLIIDGGDGADKGNFRWYKPASTYTYAFQFMPIDN